MHRIVYVGFLLFVVGCCESSAFKTRVARGVMNEVTTIWHEDVADPVYVPEWDVGRPSVGYLSGCEELHFGTKEELINAMREKDEVKGCQRFESFTTARHVVSDSGKVYLLLKIDYEHIANFHPSRFIVYECKGEDYELIFDARFGREYSAFWVVSSGGHIYLSVQSYLPGENYQRKMYSVASGYRGSGPIE